jgi:hypothetical protein
MATSRIRTLSDVETILEKGVNRIHWGRVNAQPQSWFKQSNLDRVFRNVKVPRLPLTNSDARSKVACTTRAIWSILAVPSTADTAIQGSISVDRPRQRWVGERE